MATDEQVDETTVNDRYAVTIPAVIRRRLDIEPGDKVRWTLTDDGELSVELVGQRLGVFEDFEPVDMGEGNAAEDHDEYAAGYEPRD
ncbi:AbrB family transcriptional regulator [Halobacteriales archaeon QS_9_67_17]|nr:MAG: AbrB family transcriptional regulator [Halobacteriales archaeon QS_9_67_17]